MQTERQIATRFKLKHGDAIARARLYEIWSCIKGRCLTATNRNYRNYGGRGIGVCTEWATDYLSFKNWALSNGYQDNLTIERIDNNRGYCPDNCKWVSRKEQNRNKRDNHLITINGETKLLIEWCELANLPKSTLRGRCKSGWSGSRLLQPAHRKGPL